VVAALVSSAEVLDAVVVGDDVVAVVVAAPLVLASVLALSSVPGPQAMMWQRTRAGGSEASFRQCTPPDSGGVYGGGAHPRVSARTRTVDDRRTSRYRGPTCDDRDR